MTIEEVCRVIEEKKQVLNSRYAEDTKNRDFKFIEECSRNNQVRGVEDVFKIDLWTCMKCLYYIWLLEEKPIEECCSIIDSFSPLIDSLDMDTLKKFSVLYALYCNSDNIPDVIEYFREDNKIREKKLLRSFEVEEASVISAIEKVKEVCREKDIDLTIFFENLLNHRDSFIEICALFTLVYIMKDDVSRIDMQFAELPVTIRKKERNKVINEYLKLYYEPDKLIENLSKITGFIQAKKRYLKEKSNKHRVEIRELDHAMLMLKRRAKQSEIINAKDIIRGVKDEKVKWYILKFILEHNEKYYKEIKAEVKELEDNQEANYRALLHDYHLDEVSYSIEKIMVNPISEVKEMISSLKNNNFSLETMVYALENSSLDIIKMIGDLIVKGYLSKNYVENNISIFNKDSELLEVFLNNLEVLNNYAVNPYLFNNSLDVLFGDNKIFNNNMELCSNYSLLPYFKVMNDFSFLLDDNLDNNISRFIEMGYKDYLVNNIGLLSSNNIQRLEVLRALNIPLDDEEEIRSVLDSNKDFVIPDETIDSYIPDVLSFVDEVDLSNITLNEYQVSNMEYNIGGVIVAKPKVDKLLREGSSLYQAIFEGMKLSYEEYQRVIDCLLKKESMIIS